MSSERQLRLGAFMRPALAARVARVTIAAAAPNLVVMAPEVMILLGAPPQNVGPALNVLRAKLVKAVLTDAQLIALAGTNGRVQSLPPKFLDESVQTPGHGENGLGNGGLGNGRACVPPTAAIAVRRVFSIRLPG